MPPNLLGGVYPSGRGKNQDGILLPGNTVLYYLRYAGYNIIQLNHHPSQTMPKNSLFIDSCPSEQVYQKKPDKHFTIVTAGCTYQTDKATEQEIGRILEKMNRGGPKKKLKAIPKIRGMLESGKLKIQSFCLIHSKSTLHEEVKLNFLDNDQLNLAKSLRGDLFTAMVDDVVKRHADKLGISIEQAVSAMVIQTLAFMIAVYFLKAHKMPPGELNVTLDRIPLYYANMESFNKVYKHCSIRIRNTIKKEIGRQVTLSPLTGKGSTPDPCGIKLADFLANFSAREVELGDWDEHGCFIPDPREDNMPKHTPESYEFIDWMLKKGYLLHLTPTMLQRLLRGGNFEDDLEKVQKMQKEHGCEWWRVVPPEMRTLITLSDDEQKKLLQSIINIAIYSGEGLPKGIENLVPIIGEK